MQAEQLLNRLSSVHSFCFDTETAATETGDALTIHSLQLVGIAFAFAPGDACYLPLPEDYDAACKLLAPFKAVFENTAVTKIGHNLKYDVNVLRRYGIMVQGFLWDTMIGHYLYDPVAKHGLKELSRSLLGYQQIEITELIGTGRHKLSMRDLDVSEVAQYACEDADQTLQLKDKLEPMLRERGLEKLFYEVESPLIYVLADLEWVGVKVDSDILYQQCSSAFDRMDVLSEEINQLAGHGFNISSSAQLQEVLFFELGIEPLGRTKGGNYSVGRKTLKKLLNKHAIIPKILEYKQMATLAATFLESLPDKIHPVTGRVHTVFRQARTATGRLSSEKPNLQNIPMKTELGRQIRRAFVPRDKDHVIIAADYSQIELRLMAELSRDKNLVDAFLNGLDIHKATASKIFNTPVADIGDKDRKRSIAKGINFGLNYGMSAKGLAESIWDATGEQIDVSEATGYMHRYFDEFSGVAKFHHDAYVFAVINGYSRTMFGRKRYLEDIDSGLRFKRMKARRLAINSPVQGSAADIIKMAMVNIHRELRNRGLQTRMVLTVHDELVFDAPRPELDVVVPLIRDTMQNVVKLCVPLDVKVDVGSNWLEAH
ncbi:MAG: DNA polymerase [Bacteroidia bacterium]